VGTWQGAGRRIGVGVALGCLMILVSSPVAAQRLEERGIDGFVPVGMGPTWSDESFEGLGVIAGVGVGYRFRKMGVELLADRRWHHRTFSSGVEFRAQASRVALRGLYYFRDESVRPYVGGAIGRARVRNRREFPNECRIDVNGQFRCESRLRTDSTSRAAVRSVFGGVSMPLTTRAFVRPEFEVVFPGAYIMMAATVAVGWSW
jgi:hypothetical protein